MSAWLQTTESSVNRPNILVVIWSPIVYDCTECDVPAVTEIISVDLEQLPVTTRLNKVVYVQVLAAKIVPVISIL